MRKLTDRMGWDGMRAGKLLAFELEMQIPTCISRVTRTVFAPLSLFTSPKTTVAGCRRAGVRRLIWLIDPDVPVKPLEPQMLAGGSRRILAKMIRGT
jgi:hypothetical protein